MSIRRVQDRQVVQRVDDELIVYDEENHKVFHLNTAAAIVWEQCEDASSLDDLAKALASHSELPHDEAIAGLAVQELRDAQLVEGSLSSQLEGDFSRRELTARLAGLAVALPAITAVMAPIPAMAGSPQPEPEPE